MLLVDTNAIIALLIRNTPWYENARTLHAADSEWVTEAHALVELASVLVRQIRTAELDHAEARAIMNEAEERFTDSLVRVAHWRSVEMAIEYGISAYDARFLAAGEQLRVLLVTEDAKLRRAAPALTQSINQAIG